MSAHPASGLFSDQHWRLNNLYWITDKEGRKVKFRMNPIQEQFYWDMANRNVILKARQFGFSTFIALFMLDTCLFEPNMAAGVIAHSKDAAKEIFRTKIQYPYDHLPDDLKDTVKADRSSADMLVFSNDSSIRVGTSMRSGTVQMLHVSEFGKIAVKYPEKAKEIKTGAFEAVPANDVGMIWVESTAEGQFGDFKDLYFRDAVDEPAHVLQFKRHFYPWHAHPEYTLDADQVVPREVNEYLDGLGVELSDGQRRWYAAKLVQQGDDMKREYPSTPEEAFEAAVEGSYYHKQLTLIRGRGQITKVKPSTHVVTDTMWDLGMHDSMAIWLRQQVGNEYHFIHYYECHGEDFRYYAEYLEEVASRMRLRWGRHYAPHDIRVRELGSVAPDKTRLTAARMAGIPFDIVPDIGIQDGILAVRNILPRCWFDAEECDQGLQALSEYHKHWDDVNGVFLSRPVERHWSKHGADAFRMGAVMARDTAGRPGAIRVKRSV